MMKCRICGSDNSSIVVHYQPYSDYATDVFDCLDCGCRFTLHDPSIYEKLHRSSSTYSDHRKVQMAIDKLFRAGKNEALESRISADSRNRFILEQLSGLPDGAKLLEVGCSRGYLTAALLLRGYDVLGVDISPSALEAAQSSFGNHFVTPDDSRVNFGAPYDAIYHVGTIGCLEDPIGVTRMWLSMLKPGGILVFNAPNRQICDVLKIPWSFSTPPPDLVTLFAPKFWENQFSDIALSTVNVENATPEFSAMVILVPWLLRRRRRSLLNRSLLDSVSSKFGSLVGRVGGKIGITRALPAEYGIYVTLRRDRC